MLTFSHFYFPTAVGYLIDLINNRLLKIHSTFSFDLSKVTGKVSELFLQAALKVSWPDGNGRRAKKANLIFRRWNVNDPSDLRPSLKNRYTDLT